MINTKISILGWSESSSQLSLPLEASIVQTVIDYLYTDDSAKVNIQWLFCQTWVRHRQIINIVISIVLLWPPYIFLSLKVVKSEDVEFVSNILVVADQFLLNRLKEICECQVSFVDILTTRWH